MILSIIFLLLTVIPAFFVFAGMMDAAQNKLWMAVGTVGWFLTAPFWIKTKAA